MLYLSVHVFSDLSIRASQKLMRSAPSSYQVHELNAEALETQGKWSDAEAEYREVLKKDPQAPGIHYRIGRPAALRTSASPTAKAAARREFEEELKIDSSNAGAEDVLGELARQEGQDAAAIEHFSRATKLDAGFAMPSSDWAARCWRPTALPKPSRRSKPRSNSILPVPSPISNWQTLIRRMGRKQDAAREFSLLKQTSEKQAQTEQQVRQGIAGRAPATVTFAL